MVDFVGRFGDDNLTGEMPVDMPIGVRCDGAESICAIPRAPWLREPIRVPDRRSTIFAMCSRE